ncbi:hypothetical protein C4K24_1930 [Pseudomonas chlororaphis subsp. aurantiaca]|nr:hypothetical protein C4K24_1930 [Pseudomonas chlororaphis subsp. aurantiaca]
MGIVERALLLIGKASLTTLTEAGETSYPRWQNIKRGKARVGAEELEILAKVFPEYRWWLLTGEKRPSGQFEMPVEA